MKVFVEGLDYDLKDLKGIDGRMYKQRGNIGQFDCVGYYYSEEGEVIYFLPKLFVDKNDHILSKYCNKKLASGKFFKEKSVASGDVKSLLTLFYSSIIEYRKRTDTALSRDGEALVLESNLGDSEHTYLDIILSMVNFHKKNGMPILFQYKKALASKHKKVNWARTVRKTQPIFVDDKTVIYNQVSIKKKAIDVQEDLLTLFYSVLHDVQSELNIKLHIDPIYFLYKGPRFEQVCSKAHTILRNIKHKYYSDSMVAIHRLLSLYFQSRGGAKRKRKTSEYIITKEYNLIFEDMIDKLFSDDLTKKYKPLKTQVDGKKVDHVFRHDSFLHNSEGSGQKDIFYIGDSKYYKIGARVEGQAVHKQFTYARNVISFNIDLIHKNENEEALEYRDTITEGYNITPNFFIEGRVRPENFNFEQHNLLLNESERKVSYHFENRLFDRDTLFVYYYTINFLFALKAYSSFTKIRINKFREECRPKLKSDMTKYLNSRYIIFRKELPIQEAEEFVKENFRELCGKMFSYDIGDETRVLLIAFERRNDKKRAANEYFNAQDKFEKQNDYFVTC